VRIALRRRDCQPQDKLDKLRRYADDVIAKLTCAVADSSVQVGTKIRRLTGIQSHA
jgi:hypothetical protein